ncbi:hypothetical protein [Flavihumibacter petaseus]|uniref:Uncharacterized protein n=1 Tax=Flavihumibacter petaseus NBRC 106054 TaxID=1220578 RepID=A0A0E9N380_9BACT|nr:hypothetical protein [Flavihumibacter petaseus]GAO44126.1 hypothetical protein FPE01S_03_01650 [Flavihumibacter petaseus NBRC 106054]
MATATGLLASMLSGMIGHELVFRNWEGKMIVQKAPGKRKTRPTRAMAVQNNKFKQGMVYGVRMNQDTDMKELYYRKRAPRQNVCSRALQDYLTAPEVTDINVSQYSGKPGDTIEIRAHDDFHVAYVQVDIWSAGGVLVERGDAVVQPSGLVWTYTAKAANPNLAGTKVTAYAMDIPNNEGTLSVTIDKAPETEKPVASEKSIPPTSVETGESQQRVAFGGQGHQSCMPAAYSRKMAADSNCAWCDIGREMQDLVFTGRTELAALN